MVERKARRRTPAQVAADKLEADRVRVVRWADAYGAPVRLLVGWDPDTGTWDEGSPIGEMLGYLGEGNFLSTAAARAGVRSVQALIARGDEYLVDAVEQREYIPIEVRPFIDLARQVERLEATSEVELVDVVRKGALEDPKLALMMLGRRFGVRWREQQQVFTGEEVDDRDRAVSEALSDPNTAMALAKIAHAIEDRAPVEE